MSKTIMPIIIIFLIVTPIQGHFVFNEGDTIFGCYKCESLTPNEIAIKRYIIEGGGYFLQAGEDLHKILKTVEFSELSGSLPGNRVSSELFHQRECIRILRSIHLPQQEVRESKNLLSNLRIPRMGPCNLVKLYYRKSSG